MKEASLVIIIVRVGQKLVIKSISLDIFTPLPSDSRWLSIMHPAHVLQAALLVC